MPDFLAVALAVALPLVTFAGGALVGWWARRGAVELDTWRRREETMRMLRWAAEHAISADPRISDMGVAALEALRFDSELLQPVDYPLVDAVTDAVQGVTLDDADLDDPDTLVIETDE
jgi:hypothetical protein